MIENYFKTYDATTRKEMPFKLFPRQKAFLKALAEKNEIIAVKHRQAGITTISAAWMACQCALAQPNEQECIVLIANQLAMAEEYLAKVLYFLDQCPRFLYGSQYFDPDKNSPKNTKSIYIKRNQNEFLLFNGCHVYARSSKKGATRGISAVTILAIDESAHLDPSTCEEVYSAAIACQSTVKNPKTIMISTPNGKDRLYYKLYNQALSGLNNYTIVDFRWYQDPRYNRHLNWYRVDEETNGKETFKEPTLDKLGNIEYNEEHWKDMVSKGWIPTSPWYETMCKKFGNDSIMINQELNVSFEGSSNVVIPSDVVAFHRDTNVIQITDNWELKDPLERNTWIWKDPIPGHRYIIAADVSSGSAEDATAIEVIDCDAIDENGFPFVEQVLEYSGKIVGDEIANLVDKYGRSYGNALAVIDCGGGYGDACVLGLEARHYPNIYREDPNLKDYTLGDTVNKRKVKAEDERLPGFRTNAVRTQMLDKLRERLTDNSFRVRSMRVINELDTWVWKNGRPDHMSGFHDDTLTCLAMALFIMEFYMFRKLKNASKDAVMLRSWRSSKSFLTSEDINGAQPKDSLNIAEQKPKYKMPFYSSGARERQIHKRTMAMLMLGGFKPKNF